MDENLVSCGLPAIDDELGGGLYRGSLIYLMADSMVMGELFLYYFLKNKQAYYVNTDRKPEFIKRNMDVLGFETSNIRFIDVHGRYYEMEDRLLEHGREVKDYMILDFVKKQLDGIKEKDVNLIMDTATFFFHLDVRRGLIREMVDTIYNTTKRIGGLGILYGIKEDTRSSVESEVINRCDAIFDVSLIKKPDRLVTELVIPKARDRPIHGNVLKFKIDGGVIIDLSKEIA